MTKLPFVSCLCPTYCRPNLLRKSIAMFEAQDYPADRRELVVYDDGPVSSDQPPDYVKGLQYHRINKRFESLPEKFNAIVSWSIGSVLCVWEDDDEYRPWHISAHVKALEFGSFSKPSRVLSDYGESDGNLHEENGRGRFHASIAFTRELFDKIGGWPITKRADFDQMMISRLMEVGNITDPCDYFPLSYVFRWHTNHYHGQNTMKSPSDETWYDRIPEIIQMEH